MTMTIDPSHSASRAAETSPALAYHSHITAEPTWVRRLERGSLVASTVSVGLAAGFFFTYQISVTRGLAIVDDRAYIESFQAINATIRNGWFGAVFFGSIPLLVATLALHWRHSPVQRGLLGACLTLYAATFAITAIGSVPLNDDLGAVSERTPEVLAAARAEFEDSWNTLNLARTLTCLGALVAVALVGRLGSSRPVRDEAASAESGGSPGSRSH